MKVPDVDPHLAYSSSEQRLMLATSSTRLLPRLAGARLASSPRMTWTQPRTWRGYSEILRYRYNHATDPGSSHYQVQAAVLVQVHHLQILAQDGVGLAAVWPMEIGAFGININAVCATWW